MIRSLPFVFLLLAPLVGCSTSLETHPGISAFEPGTYRVGGSSSLGFRNDDIASTKTDTLSASLDVGKLFWKQIELGARLAYDSVDTGASDTTSQTLLLFLRYYTVNIGSLRPWLEVASGYTSVDLAGSSNQDGFPIAVGLGATQFVTDSVATEFGVRLSAVGLDTVDRDLTEWFLGLAVFF